MVLGLIEGLLKFRGFEISLIFAAPNRVYYPVTPVYL